MNNDADCNQDNLNGLGFHGQISWKTMMQIAEGRSKGPPTTTNKIKSWKLLEDDPKDRPLLINLVVCMSHGNWKYTLPSNVLSLNRLKHAVNIFMWLDNEPSSWQFMEYILLGYSL
jgi:hypothetical protein